MRLTWGKICLKQRSASRLADVRDVMGGEARECPGARLRLPHELLSVDENNAVARPPAN